MIIPEMEYDLSLLEVPTDESLSENWLAAPPVCVKPMANTLRENNISQKS